MAKAKNKTDALYNRVAQGLKALRLLSGKNAKTVAYDLGVTYQTVVGWERGAFLPPLPLFVKVCAYWGVQETEVLHGVIAVNGANATEGK